MIQPYLNVKFRIEIVYKESGKIRKIRRTIFFIIVCVIFFTGCVEEEAVTPAETPTATPEQTVSTPTPTPMPTPEAAWKPDVKLKPGYKWYQNDEYGYGFAYPENWEVGWVIVKYDHEIGIVFNSPKKINDNPEAFIMVMGDSELPLIWGEKIGDLEKGIESGEVFEYGNITINGIKGFEVVGTPFPSTKEKRVLFIVNDLSYMLIASTTDELYARYENTFDDTINSFTIL